MRFCVLSLLLTTSFISTAKANSYFVIDGNVRQQIGGTITPADPPASASIWTPPDYRYFYIGGFQYEGTLTIQNGGMFTKTGVSPASFWVGSSGTGHLVVTGANSKLIIDHPLVMGLQTGHGTLRILNGGYVETTYTSTGYINAGGEILVDGAGSRLKVHNELSLAIDTGYGHVVVSNGGRIDTGALIIATGQWGTYSSILIDGTNSLINVFNSDSVIVGKDTSASLTLSNGGRLSFPNHLNSTLTLGGSHNNSSPRSLNIGAQYNATPQKPGFLDDSTNIRLFSSTENSINFNHTGAYDSATNTIEYSFNNPITIQSYNSQIWHYAGNTLFNSTINHISNYDLNVYIVGGTMFLGKTNMFDPLANIEIGRGGALNINGLDQTIYGIVNNGHISFGRGIGATLTIDGDYVVNGIASMAIEASLNNDQSITDRMIVTGDTSGTTYLRVHNRNGFGASTEDGINIIEVHGASNGNFILMGDFVTDGHQAIASGPYAYTLEKGAIAPTTRAIAPGNWYMRSLMADLNGDGNADTPILQPGVSVYEAYPQALLAMNDVPTLQQRLSNRRGSMDDGAEHFPFWFYTDMHKIKIDPRVTTTNTDLDTKFMAMRGGVDGPIYTSDTGRLLAGLGVHYMKGRTQTQANPRFFGKGHIYTTGFGFMPSLTWYGNDGFYIDAIAQGTWYQSKMSSNKIGTLMEVGNDAFGYAVSGEIGQKWAINSSVNFKLDGQLSYSDIYFDQFTDDLNAALVKNNEGKSLLGRIGATVSYTQPTEQMVGQNHFYMSANLYNEFIDRTKVTISDTMGLSPVEFVSERERVWGGINLGGTHSWANNKYTVYGEVGGRSSIKNFGDSYNLSGQVGMKIRF